MKRRPRSPPCSWSPSLLAPGAGPALAAAPKGKVVVWYDSGAAWNAYIAEFNKEVAPSYPRSPWSG